MEATSMSINGWTHKEDVIYVYNGKLLSHKKEWNNAICSNMDWSRDYHTKWNKSDREKQISYDIIYTCYPKIATSEHISTEKDTDLSNKLMVSQNER